MEHLCSVTNTRHSTQSGNSNFTIGPTYVVVVSGVSHGETERNCPLQRFDWGYSSVDCPSNASFGGTLLGLSS